MEHVNAAVAIILLIIAALFLASIFTGNNDEE